MGRGLLLRPAQVRLVGNAVLAACDAADGLADGVVSDAVGCKQRFDVTRLRCAAGAGGDTCLSDAQVKAVQTLHAPFRFSFPLANGGHRVPRLGESPAKRRQPSARPVAGARGGLAAPHRRCHRCRPTASPWIYGSGAIQYFYAGDPRFDLMQYHAREVRRPGCARSRR